MLCEWICTAAERTKEKLGLLASKLPQRHKMCPWKVQIVETSLIRAPGEGLLCPPWKLTNIPVWSLRLSNLPSLWHLPSGPDIPSCSWVTEKVKLCWRVYGKDLGIFPVSEQLNMPPVYWVANGRRGKGGEGRRWSAKSPGIRVGFKFSVKFLTERILLLNFMLWKKTKNLAKPNQWNLKYINNHLRFFEF